MSTAVGRRVMTRKRRGLRRPLARSLEMDHVHGRGQEEEKKKQRKALRDQRIKYGQKDSSLAV